MKIKRIDLVKLTKVNPAVKGYMAGFFDGEGHISIARRGSLCTSRTDPTKTRKLYGVVVGAGQNQVAPLELFYNLFGGTLRIDNRKHAKFGKTSIWEWTINGNLQCPVFLTWLIDDLIVKKEQAIIAMEFAEVANEIGEDEFLEYRARMIQARKPDEQLMKSREQ